MKWIHFFIPRIEYILVAAIFWGIAASGPKILNFDGDLPRHLLTGSLILESGQVPQFDLFSYRTVNKPGIPHEWLAQVIFFVSYELLGLSGVVLLTAVIVTATWLLVYKQTFAHSGSLLSAILFTSLAIGASLIHVLPRPHLFTYLLTAVWVIVLERIRNGQARIWWLLPLLMLLWVNLHGMFVLGIIILGIYFIGGMLDDSPLIWLTSSTGKSMFAAGIFALFATLFSPSGIKIWETIFALGSNTYITARIPEYQSANFHEPETWPFILILLLLIISFARNVAKTPWPHVLLVAAFAGIALYTSRMMPLFAIVSAPIAAKSLADWTRQEYPEGRYATMEKNITRINASSNGFIWIPIVAIMVTALFQSGKTIDPQSRGNAFDERFFPVQATAWLESHPQSGHMFNEFDWGGYLLLNLWPAQQIFMDGHTHIYGEELTREYEQVVTLSPGWENILTKYNIEWVIMRANASLINALSSSGNWSIAYQDETATILIRK
ncbi:MAG: hypothetical protein ABIQ77_07295 [Anaerolineales bacterium]